MKPRRRRLVATAVAAFLVAGGAHAQGAGPDPLEGLKIKPVMLDAKGGTGTVFGIDYSYKKAWARIAPFDAVLAADKGAADRSKTGIVKTLCGGYAEEQGKVIPSWVSFTDCAGEITAKGTLAADAARNPNKLIDTAASYAWSRTSSDRGSTRMFGLGGQTKFETDQSFDDKQLVYGLKGTFTHLAGCSVPAREASCNPRLDFFGLSLGLQRVDPRADAAREEALGVAKPKGYRRIELDAFYKYNLPKEWRYLSDIELNYHHFQEPGAPDAVRRAGLDRHRLGLVRLNFGMGGQGNFAVTPKMFVQYSRGSLPFDRKSERVVKIGLTFDVF
jgi:hypothetical protein